MKKCTLFLATFAFFFISVSLRAQTFSFGGRGGLSIPNLTAGGSDKNPLNTGYSSRLGGSGAIFSNFRCSNLFSWQPMIEYASEGGKKSGLQALPTPAAATPLFPAGDSPTYLYANFKSEAKMDYLMIPILAKINFFPASKSPWNLYADLGPFVGFLLSAKQVTSGSSMLYLDAAGQQSLPAGTQSFNNTQDIKNQLHNVNFGVEGNLGISYVFGKNSLFAEGGGHYGFLNIQKGSANGKNNVGAAVACLGYSYKFGGRK